MLSFPHKNTIYLYGLYQNIPWESEIKYPVLRDQCYMHVVFMLIPCVSSITGLKYILQTTAAIFSLTNSNLYGI